MIVGEFAWFYRLNRRLSVIIYIKSGSGYFDGILSFMKTRFSARPVKYGRNVRLDDGIFRQEDKQAHALAYRHGKVFKILHSSK